METTNSPERITKEDIRLKTPRVGGTAIVIERHGDYIKDKDSERRGSLKDSVPEELREQGKMALSGVLEQLTPNERESLDVLIVASDTRYIDKGQRAIETGNALMAGIGDAFTAKGLEADKHILNKKEEVQIKGEGGPRPTPTIREPDIFENGFFFRLQEEFPDNPWKAYEEGEMADLRKELGAESTEGVGDRLARFLDVVYRYSRIYHRKNPGRRFIVWITTHYDTISPYVKNHVAQRHDPKWYLPVDNEGGIVVNIDPNGEAKTEIAGVEYPVSIKTTSINS